MNLRDRAARDAKDILDDLGGAGTEFVLTEKNAEYRLKGSYGDIGYLLNMATGEAVEGRTIEAAFSLLSLAEKTNREPQRGWGFRCKDLVSGKEIKLFVVKYEPDKTMGIGRIKLAVNLDEQSN
ncbi:MAG: hypothetical protein FWH41_04055 [Treponema sp.]|nr:hypothetical protein [Treponema sp.]